MGYALKIPFAAREQGPAPTAYGNGIGKTGAFGDAWRRMAKAGDTESVVLLIDDDPHNLAIMSEFLEEFNYTVLAAEDGESGVKRAAFAQPDLILLDIMMPGIDGYETCRRLKAHESTRDIPVICMTALAETADKLKGFQAGVVDYITKPYQREEVLARVDVHLRLRKVTRELESARDLLEVRVAERTAELEAVNRSLEREVVKQRETEAALRESERKFHAIFDNAFEHMGLMTPDGTLLASNRTSLAFCGLQESAVVGKFFWESHWWSCNPRLQEQLKEAVSRAAQGEFVRFEVTHRGSDASLHFFDCSIKPVRDEEGRVVLLIPEGRDVTDRVKLAEQLRQSQKMEAIGTLAGGIAHDFNNLLTAIIGFGSLLRMQVPEDGPGRSYLEQILSASDRAANLTGSLLAFSRKEVLAPGPVRLNEAVKKMDKLLLRLIGEDIDLRTELEPQDLVINSDNGHIEQVLMNLAVNARDAMPNGGTLLIRTERIEVSEPHPGFQAGPGSYAVLSVSDTGEGMSEPTRQRIFEPFFTTKEVGKGSGLGLSIVYGIIQQHNGQIDVQSELGIGTTFRIFLKLHDSGVERTIQPRPLPVAGGTETILVAEDDLDVRYFITQTLRDQGYTVLQAADGEEAVATFLANEELVDLVILDAVMPKANGKEVYQQIRQSQKQVPVLFCSGYTADIINRKGVLEEGVTLMHKPMTPHQLLIKVRAALTRSVAN